MAATGVAVGVLTVGMVADNAILQQAKKAQGETNVRLDALLAEQQKTNALLGQLVQLLAAQQQGRPPVPQQWQQPVQPPRGPVSWGTQQG
ncbi:hypothetical protein V2S66_32975 [Streptomyces sp. V4-01]|uniref:Uncharacterized protein n=1 Tax=Actinacidiphila polyblastidii TaxID=3110430 RepID=A0ABU7PLQ5_9ACTN|nr:hypothetical protein [Streptomyces sp. V4-01]